jgi:hypothetical protein
LAIGLRWGPDEEHVFVYDNATTHLKRPDDAHSARKMPKFSPKHSNEWDGINWGEGKKPRNWGVETSVIDENGKLVYDKNGEVLKKKVQMADVNLLMVLCNVFITLMDMNVWEYSRGWL